jgi:tRNA(Ile)-lysidine synthetase-like protein
VLRVILDRLGTETASRETVRRVASQLSRRAESHGKIQAPGAVLVQVSCGQIFFQTPSQREALSGVGAWHSSEAGFSHPRIGRFRLVAPPHTDLVPRFFQPGDRFGGKKLKELFLEARIPAPERGLVPVLAEPGGREVKWFFPERFSWLSIENLEFPFSFSSRRLRDPA